MYNNMEIEDVAAVSLDGMVGVLPISGDFAFSPLFVPPLSVFLSHYPP